LIQNGTLEWPLSIVRYLVKVLFILNYPPDKPERGYNAFRLALALQKKGPGYRAVTIPDGGFGRGRA